MPSAKDIRETPGYWEEIAKMVKAMGKPTPEQCARAVSRLLRYEQQRRASQDTATDA